MIGHGNMRITLRKAMVSLLVAVFVSRGLQAQINCSKKASPDLSKFALVFAGKVVNTDSAGSLTYVTFKVERQWKGELMETIELLLPQESVGLSKQGLFSARGLKKFQVGESYLVYAFGGRAYWGLFDTPDEFRLDSDQQTYTTTKCTPTKELKDAKKDLEILGEGLVPSSVPISTERFDVPLLRESRRTIRFPGGYKVTLKAYGPEGYTLVLHGYLTQDVKLLGGLKRLKEDSDDLSEPISEDVVVGLITGEEAGFITPNQIEENFDYPFDFEIESTRVQDKPLTKFYAQGEVADGKLRSLSSGNGESTSVELYDLAKGFRLTISWSRVKDR
jgi:hypothetical protein